MLRQLPMRKAPRNFRLTPKMVGKNPPLPRAYPAFRFTSALATILLFLSFGLNFLRQRLSQLVDAEVEPKLQGTARQALDKILDLNLDLISRAYRDEEMRNVSLSFKLDNALVRLGKRFTFGLHLVVLLGLIALSLGVLAVWSATSSRSSRANGRRVWFSLGTLLILWLMIELLEAEITHPGGRIQFNLFVSVLVAFIRKILDGLLTHGPEGEPCTGRLCPRVIFWLVTKGSQKLRKHNPGSQRNQIISAISRGES
jgi:hypothetical protein